MKLKNEWGQVLKCDMQTIFLMSGKWFVKSGGNYSAYPCASPAHCARSKLLPDGFPLTTSGMTEIKV